MIKIGDWVICVTYNDWEYLREIWPQGTPREVIDETTYEDGARFLHFKPYLE